MIKEELFKKFNKNELEEKCNKLSVRVTFEVTCDSSPAIQNERNIAARCARYVNECFEAMDDSMRHWGDHYHCIEPLKVELESDKETLDITDDLIKYWVPNQECYNISEIENTNENS